MASARLSHHYTTDCGAVPADPAAKDLPHPLGATRSGVDHPPPTLTTTYAKFVGRVGALAFSFGVGVALAIGVNPATAWADDSPADSSSTTSSESGGNTSRLARDAADTPKRHTRVGTASIGSLSRISSESAGNTSRLAGDAADTPKRHTRVGTASIDTQDSPFRRSFDKSITAGTSDSAQSKTAGDIADGMNRTSDDRAPESSSVDDPDISAIVDESTPPESDTSATADAAVAHDEVPSGNDHLRRTIADHTGTAATAVRAKATGQRPVASTQPAQQDLAASDDAAESGKNALTTSVPLQDEVDDAIQHISGQVQAFRESAAAAVEDAKVCGCKLILKVVDAISGVVGGDEGGGGGLPPIDPDQNPVLAAMAAWVRRELEQFLAIPQVATFVQEVTDTVTVAIQDVIVCANPEDNQPLPDTLERITIASDLDQPTDFRFLPDGRIIITEKAGAVKIVANDDQNATPVTIGVIPTAANRQLSAIELDPDFENNGYIYVAYTTPEYEDKLSRFTIVDDNIDYDSQLDLVVIPGSGAMHHGNAVLFGPDGKLYWAIGDNSVSTNAQDLTSPYGKILRINPDGSVPEDNPFYALPDDVALPEVYASGFRNPFRMTFTPTGELLVADVGDQAWEELNLVVAGGNYGWPGAEGESDCDECNYIDPIYYYPHTPEPARAGSITAVLVNTSPDLGEEYQNKVLVADYTLRWIRVLTFDSTYTNLMSEATFDSDAGTTVQLLQGPDGNLYQLSIYPGELYRIAPSDGNRAPAAVLTATPEYGYAPLTIDFSSAGSSDPEGSVLTYHWDFGDGTESTDANPSRTYEADGSYDVVLTVSDGAKQDSATQTIVVGSTPPEVTILSPTLGTKYNTGDTINFSANATDADDGALPESAYKWTVVFHHADHVHPYEDNIEGSSGSVYLSTSEHNVDTTWYEIRVTVTDSSGLSTTESTRIDPNLVTLTFGSSYPGAVYTVDGIPHTGAYTETAVVGVVRDLDVPSPQIVDGNEIVFDSWSDGEGQQHEISTPGTDTTYTVDFDIVPLAT